MKISSYVRVSSDDHQKERQMHVIRGVYGGTVADSELDRYCDNGTSRDQLFGVGIYTFKSSN